MWESENGGDAGAGWMLLGIACAAVSPFAVGGLEGGGGVFVWACVHSWSCMFVVVACALSRIFVLNVHPYAQGKGGMGV